MKLQHNLYVIYAISFMDLFAVGLTFPLLQPYLRTLGFTHLTIGILISTYSALQVLTGPLIGSWSDIRGRKFVVSSTLSICIICYLLLGLTSSIFVIFVLRVILGCVKHTQTLCKAMIADLLPKEKHVEAYGQSSGFGSLGFVVGPVIGGHISQYENGFSYVCCLTATLFVINLILTSFIPNTKGASPKSEDVDILQLFKGIHKEFLRASQELIKIDWTTYWDAFLIRFLFGITISIFYTSQPLYLKERHNLSQLYIGYTISFLSIVSVLCGLSIGWITDKFYKDDAKCLKRLYHSFLILSISFVGFYVVENLYMFYLLLVPFSVASTILRIISMEMMLGKSKKDEKGSLSGASNSIMSIARFITPLSSGVISDYLGEQTVMFSAFVPAFVGTAICFKLFNVNNKKYD